MDSQRSYVSVEYDLCRVREVMRGVYTNTCQSDLLPGYFVHEEITAPASYSIDILFPCAPAFRLEDFDNDISRDAHYHMPGGLLTLSPIHSPTQFNELGLCHGFDPIDS